MKAAVALLFASLLIGSPVPEFQVVDLSGGAHAFSSLKGDTTVVVFLSARCPVSNAYNLRMESLYKDYTAKGVKFVFVNVNFNEPAKEVADHAKQAGFTFPLYRDSGNVAELFNAQVTPETFVIDKQGVIRYHGAIDDSQNEARIRKQGLRNALDELLAGKPVSIAETKAFGCTVKRAPRPTALTPIDRDAYTRTLQAQNGKVVLVDFWATWCEACREELPKLAALSKKLNPSRFALITVSADEPEHESDAASFLEKAGIGGRRYVKHADDDKSFIDAIDENWSGALPALFLYDAKGVRVSSFIGESDLSTVEAAIRTQLR